MSERFPESVSTLEEAHAYYSNRATQFLSLEWEYHGCQPLGDYGVEARWVSPEGETFKSVFIFAEHAGKGHFQRWLASNKDPYLTSNVCSKMREYLDRHHIRYFSQNLEKTGAYVAIEKFYGDRRARRSGRFLMNHIDEGLWILQKLGASPEVEEAWCLHPLVQSDEDLAETMRIGRLDRLFPDAVALAMEYRHQANAHLSKHEPKTPSWGPMAEIRLMLIADKVQNCKDYELYLRGREDVPNAERLDRYFHQEWFPVLGVTEEQYTKWVASICRRTGRTAPNKHAAILRKLQEGPYVRI